MAQPIACDSEHGTLADIMQTNIHTGEVIALCFPCWLTYAETALASAKEYAAEVQGEADALPNAGAAEESAMTALPPESAPSDGSSEMPGDRGEGAAPFPVASDDARPVKGNGKRRAPSEDATEEPTAANTV